MKSRHYYNEFDPKAAAWLRELMRGGHIPEGTVDERSIRDVRADELAGFTQCHFFAGIGGWALALRLAGWPESEEVWTGSCPCQPFSCAGKGGGTEDERHLLPDFARLIRERRPATVFGEQVASAAGRDWPIEGRAPILRLRASGRKHSSASPLLSATPFKLATLALPDGSATCLPWPSTWTDSSWAPLISGSDCSGWPTTRASDAEKNMRTEEGARKEAARRPNGADLCTIAQLAGWPTPQVCEGPNMGRNRGDGVQRNRSTPQSVVGLMAGWSTPSARDWKDTPGMATTGTNPDGTERSRLDQLPRQAGLVLPPTPPAITGPLGSTPPSSPAPTGRRGALNPAHSRWLMGYPPAWDVSAVTAMPSSRRSPRSSSPPTARPAGE